MSNIFLKGKVLHMTGYEFLYSLKELMFCLFFSNKNLIIVEEQSVFG